MNLVVMGMDHLTPIEIREKASYTSDKYKKACDYLRNHDIIDEFVILSTCNRSEVYCRLSQKEKGQSMLADFFVNFHGISEKDINKYAYFMSDEKVVFHLFDVACGLKSLVIGEDQILGQLKSAHQKSMLNKNTSAVLNRLFHMAVTTAKYIKNNTGISDNSLSISSVGIKFIEEYYKGDIKDKRVLVIGTGRMGRLAVKKLQSLGVNNITMTNRTQNHAIEFQKQVKGAVTISYHDRYKYINDVDIIISSTSSPHYTLIYDKFDRYKKDKKQLCLLDLAVPRDIDPRISRVEGINLFTIDDLDRVVQNNLKKRYEYSGDAQEIINTYYKEFLTWLEGYKRIKAAKNMNVYGNHILERQYEYAIKRLKITENREKEIIYKIIKNSLDSIVNPVVEYVKMTGSTKDMDELFKKVFKP